MFEAILKAPTLNIRAIRDSLDRQLRRTLAEGAFVWLNAAIAEIPVWSGAARATFLIAARGIDYHVDLGQAPNAPNRIPLGESLGEGGVVCDKASGVYTFSYSTTLRHLITNEYENVNPPIPLKKPGPYRFQEIAMAAYQNYLGSVSFSASFKLSEKEYTV